MKRILIWLLDAYKKNISPFLGHHCRFSPSCSDYCRQAIYNYGALKGMIMGMWRIVRCNPFTEGGFDPVKK